MSPRGLPKRIAHFDLDTFFVAVERARDASLVGKPVLVGGRGGRGVVAAASYESRVFGCHSAQPMSQALRLCPQAVVVPPDGREYSRVSKLFHQMLRDASPVVESVGIDEASVDFTGVPASRDLARIAGASDAATIAEHIRGRVRDELRIAVSVCIAGSRTTAKVGSDRAKPDGLIEVPVGDDASFLAPFAIRELPMVGPKLGDALRRVGVTTIGDAAELDPRWLETQFGRSGEVLVAHAKGRDGTPVRAGARPNRSISRENTFGEDVTDPRKLRQNLARHAQQVGADLRRGQKRARTVTLKLRWNNFETLTRSRTLDRPTQSTAGLVLAGEALLNEALRSAGAIRTTSEVQLSRPVRLIGLGATNIVEDELQLGLDDLTGDGGVGGELLEARVDEMLDSLRERFGDDAVTRGF